MGIDTWRSRLIENGNAPWPRRTRQSRRMDPLGLVRTTGSGSRRPVGPPARGRWVAPSRPLRRRSDSRPLRLPVGLGLARFRAIRNPWEAPEPRCLCNLARANPPLRRMTLLPTSASSRPTVACFPPARRRRPLCLTRRQRSSDAKVAKSSFNIGTCLELGWMRNAADGPPLCRRPSRVPRHRFSALRRPVSRATWVVCSLASGVV